MVRPAVDSRRDGESPVPPGRRAGAPIKDGMFACCILLGCAVFLYPVLVAATPATVAVAGCAFASLVLGLVTRRWLGAGVAAGLAMANYALALPLGARQPDIYAPVLALASWLLLELFDLALMSREPTQIRPDVLDWHRRGLFAISGTGAVASAAVLLAGGLFSAHPALLPAAAAAGAAAVVGAVALTRRAVG